LLLLPCVAARPNQRPGEEGQAEAFPFVEFGIAKFRGHDLGQCGAGDSLAGSACSNGRLAARMLTSSSHAGRSLVEECVENRYATLPGPLLAVICQSPARRCGQADPHMRSTSLGDVMPAACQIGETRPSARQFFDAGVRLRASSATGIRNCRSAGSDLNRPVIRSAGLQVA
jgi:hypothetical protein